MHCISMFVPMVSIFFLYELQFPLFLDIMICNTEFESVGSGTNPPGPEKRNCGLGKSGVGPSIAPHP